MLTCGPIIICQKYILFVTIIVIIHEAVYFSISYTLTYSHNNIGMQATFIIFTDRQLKISENNFSRSARTFMVMLRFETP